MLLSDDTITLRAVQPDDLDFLFLLENSDGARRCGLSSDYVSRQILWEYIENYSDNIFADKQLRLVITEVASAKPIGTIDISDFDARHRRGFVGIIINEAYRRHGYATRALNLLCRYASNHIGMYSLAALIATDNVASLALFSRCGFDHCGTLRGWVKHGASRLDVVLCQKLLQNL